MLLIFDTDCVYLPKIRLPVSRRKERTVSFVATFEEHFAVTLSAVSPLAKEMPFTGTLKIIKHIMDITVTL